MTAVPLSRQHPMTVSHSTLPVLTHTSTYRSAPTAPHAATAIADTAVELLVMNHHELKARMGAAAVAELAFLWTLESLEAGGTASSDQHAGQFYPGNSDEGIK